MTPERIAEIRAMPHDNWRIVHELLEALDAANAELSRLRSSPAPVVGGVPDQEWNGPLLYDLLRMDSDEPDWEGAAKRVHDWFASRLPALKPGEVVEAFRAGYGKGHFDGVADHYGELTKSVTELFRAWQESRVQAPRTEGISEAWWHGSRLTDLIDASPTPTEKETDHG